MVSYEDNPSRMLPLAWSDAHSLSLPCLVQSQAPPLKQKRVQGEEAREPQGAQGECGESKWSHGENPI